MQSSKITNYISCGEFWGTLLKGAPACGCVEANISRVCGLLDISCSPKKEKFEVNLLLNSIPMCAAVCLTCVCVCNGPQGTDLSEVRMKKQFPLSPFPDPCRFWLLKHVLFFSRHTYTHTSLLHQNMKKKQVINDTFDFQIC